MTPQELAEAAKAIYDGYTPEEQAAYVATVRSGVADDTRPGAVLTERQAMRLSARQIFLSLIGQG